LDGELAASELREQSLRLIASSVADEFIECRPSRGMQRDGDQCDTAWAGDTRQLGESAVVVVDVLDHIESAHEIETPREEGKGSNSPEHHVRPTLLQLRKRRCADVDEPCGLEGQPGPQAGGHLESPLASGDERLDERPGIEAMRHDEPRSGPEGIIEAAVGVEEFGTAAHRLDGKLPHASHIPALLRSAPTRMAGGTRVYRCSASTSAATATIAI